MQRSPTRNLCAGLIGVGLCWYLLLLALTGLGHHHKAHVLNDPGCQACFFSANHLAVEPVTVDLVHLQNCIPIQPLLLPVFLPTVTPDDVLGRAPPSSSI
ncbi:hypothetical protein HYR99_13895 [Candidatus Poribacteria bacterium]|nr:hypothetical protein [Candidatus Poribacteria bacterium]